MRAGRKASRTWTGAPAAIRPPPPRRVRQSAFSSPIFILYNAARVRGPHGRGHHDRAGTPWTARPGPATLQAGGRGETEGLRRDGRDRGRVDSRHGPDAAARIPSGQGERAEVATVRRRLLPACSRRAIEVAEHYADGSSGDADRIFSSKAAWAACATPAGADPRRCVRSWRKWCDLGGMKLATMGLRFDNKGLGGPDPRVGGSGRRAWRGPRRRPAFRQCRRAAGRRGRITQQSRTNRGR